MFSSSFLLCCQHHHADPLQHLDAFAQASQLLLHMHGVLHCLQSKSASSHLPSMPRSCLHPVQTLPSFVASIRHRTAASLSLSTCASWDSSCWIRPRDSETSCSQRGHCPFLGFIHIREAFVRMHSIPHLISSGGFILFPSIHLRAAVWAVCRWITVVIQLVTFLKPSHAAQ